MEIKQSNQFGALLPEELDAFERKYFLRLPKDYRQFLLRHNGGGPEPDTVDFVIEGKATSSDVQYLYGVHDGEYWASIEQSIASRNGRIVSEGLPIGGDSAGNEYVLILEGEKRGQIYFWDHELETDPPSYENMSYVASSFTEFTEKLYKYIPPDESEVDRIIRENDLTGLIRLLDSGYDIESTDEYGRTLIENAAIQNLPEMIQVLFDRGGKLRNALQIARENYEFFEEHKASVDLLERLQTEQDSR